MCGLFGWQWSASVKTTKQHRLATVLGLSMDDRGGDSYGWWADGHVFKGMGDILAAVGRLPGRRTVMAHTRYATVGEKTKRNSHPFTVGPVTLAHNGGVGNNYTLKNDYKRDKVEVDSEHLAHHFAEDRGLEDVDVWGAIEWVDKRKPGRVFLTRLKTGSLYVCSTKEGVLWASTEEAVKKGLAAAGLSMTDHYLTPPGEVLYVENGALFTTKKVLTTKEEKPKELVTYYGGHRHWRNRADYDYLRDYDERWWQNNSPTPPSPPRRNRVSSATDTPDPKPTPVCRPNVNYTTALQSTKRDDVIDTLESEVWEEMEKEGISMVDPSMDAWAEYESRLAKKIEVTFGTTYTEAEKLAAGSSEEDDLKFPLGEEEEESAEDSTRPPVLNPTGMS